jgi:hypothetical protein
VPALSRLDGAMRAFLSASSPYRKRGASPGVKKEGAYSYNPDGPRITCSAGFCQEQQHGAKIHDRMSFCSVFCCYVHILMKCLPIHKNTA